MDGAQIELNIPWTEASRAPVERLSLALEHGRIGISESRLLSYDLKEVEELGEGGGKMYIRQWHRLEHNERTC